MMINVARTRMFLWVVTGCLVAGGLAAALVMARPVRVPDPEPAAAPVADATDSANAEGQLSEAQLAAVWDRDLQRPLYDQPVAVAREPEPQLDVRLAGTVIEPGRSQAMFMTSSGQIERRSVGEMVNDQAKVLDIQPDRVTLLHNGREVTLEIEPVPEARRRR